MRSIFSKIAADRVVLGVLALALVAAPLPFGSDLPWAWSLWAAAIGFGLILHGVRPAWQRPPAAPLRPIGPSIALFSAAALWAAAQSVVPVADAWRHPLWHEAEAALGMAVRATVSLDAYETGSALMRLLTYGGVFLLAYRLCPPRRRAERLVRVLIAAGVAYACYGLAVQLGGWNTVLWYDKTSDIGQLSSTFPNRNAFATYAGLLTMAAVGLMFRPVLRRGDLQVGWRFMTKALIGYAFVRVWMLALAALLLFIAVLATHSRAGLAVTLLGLAVLLSIVTWARRGRRLVLASSCAIAICGVALLVAGGGGTVDRLAKSPSAAAERGEIFARTMDAIGGTPMLGTGFGTFGSVFPMYRGERLRPPVRRAHNSYLENALELGLPAAAAIILAIAWPALMLVRSLRERRRDAYFPGLGIAVLVLAGTHALVDYSLQVPAVSMTFAAILGVCCAQTLRLDPGPGESPGNPRPRAP